MKSVFQLKEVKDLTTQNMSFNDYLKLLKKDLKKLPKKATKFFSAPKFQFKDKKETILMVGTSRDVTDWHKTLEVKKYLLGTCELAASNAKLILISGKKGSDDAIIKQLKGLLEDLGYTVAAKASITDKRAAYVEPTSLIEQLTYYNKTLEDILNYKDKDIKAVLQVLGSDTPNIRRLKESLYDKLQKAKNSFTNQLYRLYENKEGMPQKNIDALEDKFAKNWTAVLKLIKTVEKKLGAGSSVVYNEIQFVNVSKSTIEKYDDEGHLRDLASGDLNDRHPKTGSLLNKPLHQHLDNGSKGMAFYYKEEENGSITPVVYDFAANRNGNKYQWAKGGQSSGPPKIS